jgi:ABC-2 type transport system ATP-binding protein
MVLYAIENLTQRYEGKPTPANDRITFMIDEGEFFGLLGDNGAGKTTLVKQMANLLRPTSGSVRLSGRPVHEMPLTATRQIGYMPQSGLALNNATAGEALYFTAHLRGMSRHDSRQERDRLLALLNIDALRHTPIPRLSSGQRRLVSLALTLATHPRILILDEPTNDLAPQNRFQVWEILRQLNTEHGTTIVLVTHNVLEAEKVIQRVGIMSNGKLVAIGRPGALKAQLNQKLRLEVIFTPGTSPDLPINGEPKRLAPGRLQYLIAHEDAPACLDMLRQSKAVEDFRLSTASLEDLYLDVMAHEERVS